MTVPSWAALPVPMLIGWITCSPGLVTPFLLSSSIDLRRFAFGRLYLHLWRSLLDLGLH